MYLLLFTIVINVFLKRNLYVCYLCVTMTTVIGACVLLQRCDVNTEITLSTYSSRYLITRINERPCSFYCMHRPAMLIRKLEFRDITM